MSFDTLAPIYRSLEAVTAGGILQRCRTAFLPQASGCRHALLLGEGPGRFLVQLLRTNPHIEVLCVEQSPRMIQVAQRELQRNRLNDARVIFDQDDVLTWQAPGVAFDMVVTNFFLDCFRADELQCIIEKVAARAGVGARWLLADFRLPERGWQKYRARMVLMLMYWFFRLATELSARRLTPPDGFLEAAGFRRAGRRLANFGLVYSDLWLRSER
jgi:SAM-dependent methyltransferase